jgi:hypothetical protein
MLIVFVAISVSGVTFFIIQRLSSSAQDEISTQCVYLAQSGVHNALYWFRYHDLSANGYFSLGQTNIDANNFFVIGANAADLLMANTNAARLSPTSGPQGQRRRNLIGLTIQNATNSPAPPVTVDRMIVTWNNSRRLQTIRINGNTLWSGNASTPANCNITNFTLNTTPSIYNINYLNFNGDMNGTSISITFQMIDSSSKTVAVYPASANSVFTLKSTGKTTGSNMYRTTQIDYNALTGKIRNMDDISAQMLP